jgi:DNA-binding XRE family transcriptional regulator
MGYPEMMTHDELVGLGRDWLIKPYAAMADYGHTGCAVVITEISCNTWLGEQPDVLGFTSSRSRSILIECKASRSDFRADKDKPFRKHPEFGLGLQRWFLAPAGIIPVEEIPEKWGLLEAIGKKISVTKKAEVQGRNYDSELNVLISVMRRLNLQPGNHVSIKEYKLPSMNRATFYIDKKPGEIKKGPKPKKELYWYIGQRISEYRKEAGLSQQELARRMGLCRTAITHYETGTHRISIPGLYEIADFFDRPVFDFLPESMGEAGTRQ